MNQLMQIYKALLKEYSYQGWWPVSGKYNPGDHSFPNTEQQKFEICIGAILTQNTSWLNVEKALKNLSKAGLLNPVVMSKVKEEVIAKLIVPAGYFNQKAKKIKLFLEFLEKKPITRDNLLSVWGIGPETADSILLYAYKKPKFVIDSYTKRIMSRIGLCTKDVSYYELQHLFESKLKKDYKLFNEYHALFVEHAKQYCLNKPICKGCPIHQYCGKIY